MLMQSDFNSGNRVNPPRPESLEARAEQDEYSESSTYPESGDCTSQENRVYTPPESSDYIPLGSMHYENGDCKNGGADTIIEFWKDSRGAVYYSMRRHSEVSMSRQGEHPLSRQDEVCHNFLTAQPEDIGPQTAYNLLRGVTRQIQHDPTSERQGITGYDPRRFYLLVSELKGILNPAYS